MRTTTFRILLALLPFSANAQSIIQGRVVDEATKEALGFVHVLPAAAQQGVTSDIGGRFAIQVEDQLDLDFHLSPHFINLADIRPALSKKPKNQFLQNNKCTYSKQ